MITTDETVAHQVISRDTEKVVQNDRKKNGSRPVVLGLLWASTTDVGWSRVVHLA